MQPPVPARDHLEPVVDHLDPGTVDRIRMTVSCRDGDALPKVTGAGTIVTRDGIRAQVMHNGVLVEEGGYYGPWMTEIIRCLQGVHEPQEEVVFAAVLERLRETVPTDRQPVLVELGSFWAYYSLWFLDELPQGRTVGVEPDPNYLEVGRRNFALNRREGTFLHGAIGCEPGGTTTFVAESDGRPVEIPVHDLASVLAAADTGSIDILLADIQGAETALLHGALPLLREGRVRFVVLSTHHREISGSFTTHQQAVALLREAGAYIVAEHSVGSPTAATGSWWRPSTHRTAT